MRAAAPHEIDKPLSDPVKISINFSPPAARWLAQEANKRSITVTEVVRRIIDEVRQDYFVRKE